MTGEGGAQIRSGAAFDMLVFAVSAKQAAAREVGFNLIKHSASYLNHLFGGFQAGDESVESVLGSPKHAVEAGGRRKLQRLADGFDLVHAGSALLRRGVLAFSASAQSRRCSRFAWFSGDQSHSL
jgi:hypothetical protein